MKYFAALASVFACCSLLFADQHEEGFYPLFNGETLAGWDGKPDFWSVQDGAITGQTTKERPTAGNTFLIWRAGSVDDFELRLKFKIVGGNSGIQYRSKDLGDHVVGGYQADFEAGDTYSGILYEERGRGILAQRGQLTHVVPDDGRHAVHVVASLGDTDEINKVIKKEDWNEYQIIAHGNHLMHIINGRVTVQVVDDDKEKAAVSGILALQLHAGPPMRVQFKDIWLRPLKGISLSGGWQFDVDVVGNRFSPKFSFTELDGKLTGDYTGLLGAAKFEGRKVGDSVSWTFKTVYDGNDVECAYEGKVIGIGQMQGRFSINGGAVEGTWKAARE